MLPVKAKVQQFDFDPLGRRWNVTLAEQRTDRPSQQKQYTTRTIRTRHNQNTTRQCLRADE